VRKYLLGSLCLLAALAVSAQHAPDAYHYVVRKNISCKNGVVVSAHALASEVGRNILQQGGNAVDAAIAVQFALAVVYPGAGNIGGGGFMVVHLASGRNLTIDYRETAPAAATRNMYLDSAGNPRMDLSQNGHLSAGVPGSVAGMMTALHYARFPLATLIQPAIDLAQKGFRLSAAEAAALNETKDEFIKLNTVTPVFVKPGGWKEGDTLVQRDLAKTLRLIRDHGAAGFYSGETARLLVAEMQRGHGIITAEDLAHYRAPVRAPLSFDYEGYRIVTMPLPSSGGIILEQCLGMCQVGHLHGMKFETPAAVQLMVEAERRSFADRAQYMGDPDFVKVPVGTLVSRSYLQERMADYVAGKAGNSRDIQAGVIREREETTHFDVLDRAGNAVSVTTTLNGSFGSRTVVAGAGFLLNNEMDDFSVKPGVPNMYGAVGAEANAISPGKRMLSSMTPTIVLRNNRPFMVVGTPGGTTIPTSVLQSVVDVLDFHMTPAEAVNRPKFHHQWLPDVVYVEKGFDEGVRRQLESMGYRVKERDAIGRTEVVLRDSSGNITAVADHRGDDSAAGY